MVRLTIDSCISYQLLKKIPGMLPGIFFFWAASAAYGQIQLARELFDEGNWKAGVRESLRVLNEQPGNSSATAILLATGLRLNAANEKTISGLEDLAGSLQSDEMRSFALYEAACALQRGGNSNRAFDLFARIVEGKCPTNMLARSSRAMQRLIDNGDCPPGRKKEWQTRLKTCAQLWTPAVRTRCDRDTRRPSSRLLGKPGKWIVSFYRAVVAPAIGARCSLVPSCSQYFRQASDRHGLLAFPIIADRLVREPSENTRQDNIAMIGGLERHKDPLSDHDWWLTSKDGQTGATKP